MAIEQIMFPAIFNCTRYAHSWIGKRFVRADRPAFGVVIILLACSTEDYHGYSSSFFLGQERLDHQTSRARANDAVFTIVKVGAGEGDVCSGLYSLESFACFHDAFSQER